MKYLVNVQGLKPDDDEHSLRFNVKNRKSETLRDTYFLIDPKNSPSQKLKMGHTTIYATGKTTGHAHGDMEEVYFVVSGEGLMEIGKEKLPIKAGDAFYVPPGEYHTTYQKGNIPLTVLWVTCPLTNNGSET